MPSHNQEGSLHRDIKIVGGLMLGSGQYDAANWLSMAFANPSICTSTSARIALQSAACFARESGFAAVAKWIERDILPRSGSQ